MPVKLEHVNFIYSPGSPSQKKALNDINLLFEDGCFTALIGKTGSGKSTLIQHLNGLLLPTSGVVEMGSYLIDMTLEYKKNGKVFVRSGPGIVADSIPEKEYEECINKAKAVVNALKLAEEADFYIWFY